MVVQKDQYIFNCIEYVELNPIRATLSESPFDYPWSSWLSRMGHRKDGILDIPQF